MVRLVKLVQLSKDLLPIETTLLPIVTFAKLSQPENAQSSILVTLSPIITSLRLVRRKPRAGIGLQLMLSFSILLQPSKGAFL